MRPDVTALLFAWMSSLVCLTTSLFVLRILFHFLLDKPKGVGSAFRGALHGKPREILGQ